MPQENVEIVRRLIEAWGGGDYPAALDSIDPEIEVNSSGAAELCVSNLTVGKPLTSRRGT